LCQANMKRDVAILDEVATLLSEVRAGWVESVKQTG
jgi:flagellin-specific chaperone FliS